jgi:phospholipid-translocating ATPase
VLQFFPIFGGNNPALNAVPLILIIVVTAIKDAIEDWRRTILDNELNNTPVYRLADWSNVNSTEDSVSLWRRFKKACTRALFTVYRKVKSIRRKEAPASSDDESRNSFASERQSLYSPRHSYVAADSEVTAIQMTSVTPSDPDTQFTSPNDLPRTPVRESAASLSRKPGSVVNRLKPTPETARFQRDYWKDIQVGDFVRLYDGDQIPADLVIISSSDPEGTCYLETKNLDGETNLKVRQALHCGHQVRHALDCEKAEFVIESEGPHPNLYAYNGAIRWKQRNEMVEPITINNMLLRGCSLQNTSWVLGLVVFTGAETKIMLNSGVTPSKRPRLAHEMNWNVLYNFAILVIMCLLSGFINGFAWGTHNSSLNWFEYGSYGGSSPVEGLVSFLVGIILFQNLIPIALYISLEIIRTFQALFIYYDSYMVYERLGMGCTPKSWNISDDLGQIEYIFSDKTGTLTQNVMEFKKCTINGMSYGEAYTEAQFGMRKRDGFDATTEAALAHQRIADEQVRMLRMLRDIHNNPYLKDGNLTFIAPDFVSDLQGRSGSNQQKAVESFMVALALCHTVITEHAPGDPPQIEFKAQSPDEAALVATARDCGFTLLGRRGDVLTLNVMGEERTYTVLKTLEFNSTRKRMSVIIQMPDGTVRLFCKGADSIIYSRLTAGQHQQQELQKSTAQHLEMFAREGLRTLCVAERVLDLQEYRAWDELHDLAAQAITNRDEKLEEVANSIEQELTLLGGTAIEDRLQDGVPSTIALLAEAGIKLWVLTGDRVETAINIGFSCNLLNEDMDLLLFNTHTDKPNAEAAAWELEKHLSKFGLTGSDEELIEARLDHSPPIGTHALVIDGDNLKFMLEDDLKQKFLLLCKQCKSVLCCRVSPAQKASVVRMVKDGLKVVALAIGDGANDVAMIQEADIGVGIAGEEGRQAVMCSDYAIGQFRFLQRLIMVHGRWAYRRLGEATANFFYKVGETDRRGLVGVWAFG